MFNRFTERARNILMYAHEESQNFKHGYVGTEHIILGILKEEESIAASALINAGVDYNKVKELVNKYIGVGDIEMPKNEIALTPRTKDYLN